MPWRISSPTLARWGCQVYYEWWISRTSLHNAISNQNYQYCKQYNLPVWTTAPLPWRVSVTIGTAWLGTLTAFKAVTFPFWFCGTNCVNWNCCWFPGGRSGWEGTAAIGLVSSHRASSFNSWSSFIYFLIGCINGLVCFLMFSHLASICLSLSLSPVELSVFVSLFSDCLLAALDFLLWLSSFSFFLLRFCSIFWRTSTRVNEETGMLPSLTEVNSRYVKLKISRNVVDFDPYQWHLHQHCQ